MLAGLMTKLKRPRKASSSSAARKKEPPKKAIPAKKGKPAAKAGKAAKAPAKAKKPAAKAPTKASKPAAKVPTNATKAATSGNRTAGKPSKAVAAKASKVTAKPAKVAVGKPSKPVAAPSASSSAAPKAAKAQAAPKLAPKVTKDAAAKPVPKAAKPPIKGTKAAASSQLALPLASQAGADRDAADDAGDADEASEPDEPAPESARKVKLKALLHDALEQQLASARVAHHAAVEGATHEEARPENDKDTRGLEQSYLARGHAQRVADLEAGLVSLAEMSVLALGEGAPIALGAIVKIDDGDHLRSFLLAPAGGGMVLPGEITVLTPTSPIGRALLGRGVDDECEVGTGAHARTLSIVAVE